MGELKALHIMCKQDTESVKVAPERVLSNRGISKIRTWPGFRREGVISGGSISVHWSITVFVELCTVCSVIKRDSISTWTKI